MTAQFTPMSAADLRSERKRHARLIRQRKMLSLMDAGVAQSGDDLEFERDPRAMIEFVLRWLDGLTQAIYLVEKRERTGSLSAGEQTRLVTVGDRLRRAHDIFTALAAVEAEIDAKPRAELESWNPAISVNWPE